jgi:hypothetical protein
MKIFSEEVPESMKERNIAASRRGPREILHCFSDSNLACGACLPPVAVVLGQAALLASRPVRTAYAQDILSVSRERASTAIYDEYFPRRTADWTGAYRH